VKAVELLFSEALLFICEMRLCLFTRVRCCDGGCVVPLHLLFLFVVVWVLVLLSVLSNCRCFFMDLYLRCALILTIKIQMVIMMGRSERISVAIELRIAMSVL